MAEYADVSTPEDSAPEATNEIIFHGTPRTMVVGFSLLLAGILAFVMDFTHVFFTEALAWVFIIWGALFLLNDFVDYLETWRVTDSALINASPARFWNPSQAWPWKEITRVDVIVKRPEPDVRDIEMQVHHNVPGEISLHRADRVFSPQLARIIVERAGLKPAHQISTDAFESVQLETGTYTWNRSGKVAA